MEVSSQTLLMNYIFLKCGYIKLVKSWVNMVNDFSWPSVTHSHYKCVGLYYFVFGLIIMALELSMPNLQLPIVSDERYGVEVTQNIWMLSIFAHTKLH